MIEEYTRPMTWEEKIYVTYKEIYDLKLEYEVEEGYYNNQLEHNLNRLYRLLRLSDMSIELVAFGKVDFEKEYYNLKYIYFKALEIHLLCISILATDGYTEEKHKKMGGNVL